jgi:hypothetical protein
MPNQIVPRKPSTRDGPLMARRLSADPDELSGSTVCLVRPRSRIGSGCPPLEFIGLAQHCICVGDPEVVIHLVESLILPRASLLSVDWSRRRGADESAAAVKVCASFSSK